MWTWGLAIIVRHVGRDFTLDEREGFVHFTGSSCPEKYHHQHRILLQSSKMAHAVSAHSLNEYHNHRHQHFCFGQTVMQTCQTARKVDQHQEQLGLSFCETGMLTFCLCLLTSCKLFVIHTTWSSHISNAPASHISQSVDTASPSLPTSSQHLCLTRLMRTSRQTSSRGEMDFAECCQ